MDPRQEAAERVGYALAHAVVRSRAAARLLSEPAVRERLLAAGRSVAPRAPDVAERAAQHVVDRALWGIALRAGFLGAAIHQVRPAAGRAAGKLARGVAERARGVEDSQEPGSQRPADRQS
ncbi:MAG TPA: hypothetical protein VKF59_20275 [Candidatus Dormibacteraeota bacterium]|nr:hypothetical protein [Candidatus Dormibacteraeota bacterium]